MLFQVYGENALYQWLGWAMVFIGLKMCIRDSVRNDRFARVRRQRGHVRACCGFDGERRLYLRYIRIA